MICRRAYRHAESDLASQLLHEASIRTHRSSTPQPRRFSVAVVRKGPGFLAELRRALAKQEFPYDSARRRLAGEMDYAVARGV